MSRRSSVASGVVILTVLVVVSLGLSRVLSTTPVLPAPKVLFGVGDEISGAKSTPIYRAGSVNMVTSWYNKPSDLDWMSGYAKGATVSNLYGQGKALELVVWLANDPSYAVSSRFQTDIKKLISIYKGNGPHYGPLYVVLFTELETYSSDPAYDVRLRSAYLEAVKAIHSLYRQAYVSLGFGGYGWSAKTPVRNLSFWRSAIEASDFTAFQAMQDQASVGPNGDNLVVTEIRKAVRQLGSYGKPVMISHFKLWGEPAKASATFGRVASTLLSEPELRTLTDQGLFAWDFMGDHYIDDAGAGLTKVGPLVARYAGPPTGLHTPDPQPAKMVRAHTQGAGS